MARPSTATQNTVGLVPAAGRASRLGPLPCSKEILPVGLMPKGSARGGRPKVACHYLFDRMRRAGIRRACVVLRRGKWDIPAYLGSGAPVGMNLAYLMMRRPHGVPYTLDEAYPFVRANSVALGFPDVLFEPADAFARVLERLFSTPADVVLGLFPAHRPQKVDMVDADEKGRVHALVIKPATTSLRFSWIIAAWTPLFSQFMHEYVSAAEGRAADAPELFVGDVVQAALDDGLRVEGLRFPDGRYVDIGTPEGLARARRRYGAPAGPHAAPGPV